MNLFPLKMKKDYNSNYVFLKFAFNKINNDSTNNLINILKSKLLIV